MEKKKQTSEKPPLFMEKKKKNLPCGTIYLQLPGL